MPRIDENENIDDILKNDPIKEDPVKENPGKEDPIKEDSAKNDPVKQEPNKEDPAKDAPKAPENRRDPNAIRINMSHPLQTWWQLREVKDPSKLTIENPEAIDALDEIYETKMKQVKDRLDSYGEAKKTKFDKFADKLDPGKFEDLGSVMQWFIYVSFKMISEYNKGYREAQTERLRAEAESIRQLSNRLRAEQRRIAEREKRQFEQEKQEKLIDEIKNARKEDKEKTSENEKEQRQPEKDPKKTAPQTEPQKTDPLKMDPKVTPEGQPNMANMQSMLQMLQMNMLQNMSMQMSAGNGTNPGQLQSQQMQQMMQLMMLQTISVMQSTMQQNPEFFNQKLFTTREEPTREEPTREEPVRKEDEPIYESVGDERNYDFLDEAIESIEDMPDTPEKKALLDSIRDYRDYFEKHQGAGEDEIYSKEGKDFYDRLDQFLGRNGDLSKLSPEMKEGLENLLERGTLNINAQNEKNSILTEDTNEQYSLNDAEEEKENAFDEFREARIVYEAAQRQEEAARTLQENMERESAREMEQLQQDAEKLETSINKELDTLDIPNEITSDIPNETIWISGEELGAFKEAAGKMDLTGNPKLKEDMEKLNHSIDELNGAMGQSGLHEREYVRFYKDAKDFIESSKDSNDPLVQEVRKQAQEMTGRLETNDRIGKLQKLDNYHASVEKLTELNDAKEDRKNFWEKNIEEIKKKTEEIRRQMAEKKAAMDQRQEAFDEKKKVIEAKKKEASEKAVVREQRMTKAKEQINKAKMMRESARKKRLEKRMRSPKKEPKIAFAK